jgi:hypothetical protein
MVKEFQKIGHVNLRTVRTSRLT